MIRPIVLWPDPVLSRPCAPVAALDDHILTLARDMLETMYDAPGRGLAAPQVGVSLRLFVMDTDWKDGPRNPRVFVNPRIVWQSRARVTSSEGCLSIPGVMADVPRSAKVTLEWTTLDGGARRETLAGFAALCAQHELDHLYGILTLDRVDAAQRAALEKAYAA